MLSSRRHSFAHTYGNSITESKGNIKNLQNFKKQDNYNYKSINCSNRKNMSVYDDKINNYRTPPKQNHYQNQYIQNYNHNQPSFQFKKTFNQINNNGISYNANNKELNQKYQKNQSFYSNSKYHPLNDITNNNISKNQRERQKQRDYLGKININFNKSQQNTSSQYINKSNRISNNCLLQSEAQHNNYIRSRQNRKQFLKQAEQKLMSYQSKVSQQDKKQFRQLNHNQYESNYQNQKNHNQKQHQQYNSKYYLNNYNQEPSLSQKNSCNIQRVQISNSKKNSLFCDNQNYSKLTPREKSLVLRQQLEKSRNNSQKPYNFNQNMSSINNQNARNLQQDFSYNQSIFDVNKTSSENKLLETLKPHQNKQKSQLINSNMRLSNNLSNFSSNFSFNQDKDRSFVKVFERGMNDGNQRTLSKLNKINELNDKINQRIRKIIQNFEGKKPFE